MILLTRLNGERFALNVDLIERAETTPDTVIRTVEGSNYVVTETIEEVIEKVIDFKAAVINRADAVGSHDQFPPTGSRDLGQAGRDGQSGQTKKGDINRNSSDRLHLVPDTPDGESDGNE